MRPLLFIPEVWLWISGKSFKTKEATTFAKKHLKQFVFKVLTYIPYKAKRMNNASSQVVAPLVTLLFVIRKGKDGVPKGKKSSKKVYNTFNCTFPKGIFFSIEAKHIVHHSKMWMGFYIDIL